VSFAAITLCIASGRVFIVTVVYFVIRLVRKLLDSPSYLFTPFERSSSSSSSSSNYFDGLVM
jgi:hypothetical protein